MLQSWHRLDIAAEVLVTAGNNRVRIRSEAAFAKMCGACPIPAGSGKTNGRHRLHRGGNRKANAALNRAVIVRIRWHELTIAYVTRRTADGRSKREIIRCLKRYLARESYQLLPPPMTSSLRTTHKRDWSSDQLAIYRCINSMIESTPWPSRTRPKRWRRRPEWSRSTSRLRFGPRLRRLLSKAGRR